MEGDSASSPAVACDLAQLSSDLLWDQPASIALARRLHTRYFARSQALSDAQLQSEEPVLLRIRAVRFLLPLATVQCCRADAQAV